MKNRLSLSSLIEAIERFYVSVSVTILHKRMESYHRQSSNSTKPYANDIKSPLLECINEIIENGQGNPEPPDVFVYSDPVGVTIRPHTAEELRRGARYVLSREDVGELSKYFKARAGGSDLHPGIKEKLERSTWEHIHAAIRYARQGDSRNASMHAAIANSACKELAHYMVEEQCREFILGIEEHLEIFKPDNTAVNQ